MATSTNEPLLIPAEIHDAMIAHCVKAAGRACCGILAGTPARVSALYPLGNIAQSPNRYESDPGTLIRATLDLRARGLTIAAIYHFCPASPPVPSPTDILENHYGDTPRVIVSLGKVVTVRVWRLTPESYEELDWRLLPREVDPEGGERDIDRPAIEQNDHVGVPRSLRGSILSRMFRWLWPPTGTSGARRGDSSNNGPEPM
jgi:proteasome lid subunit RPN8/RPN11